MKLKQLYCMNIKLTHWILIARTLYQLADWRIWDVSPLCKVRWMICTYTSQSLCNFTAEVIKCRTKNEKCVVYQIWRILHMTFWYSARTVLVSRMANFMNYIVCAIESIKHSWSLMKVLGGGHFLSKQWILFLKWKDASWNLSLIYYIKGHVNQTLVSLQTLHHE